MFATHCPRCGVRLLGHFTGTPVDVCPNCRATGRATPTPAPVAPRPASPPVSPEPAPAPLTDATLRELRETGRLHALAKARAEGGGAASRAEEVVSLDLSGTGVTDAGLAELAPLVSLRELRLDGTAVTDEGLPALRALISLASLDLSSTRVTDAGLRSLGELKRLRTLDLWGTAVTDSGVARLREALPGCEVRPQACSPPAGPRRPVDLGLWLKVLGGVAGVLISVLWVYVEQTRRDREWKARFDAITRDADEKTQKAMRETRERMRKQIVGE